MFMQLMLRDKPVLCDSAVLIGGCAHGEVVDLTTDAGIRRELARNRCEDTVSRFFTPEPPSRPLEVTSHRYVMELMQANNGVLLFYRYDQISPEEALHILGQDFVRYHSLGLPKSETAPSRSLRLTGNADMDEYLIEERIQKLEIELRQWQIRRDSIRYNRRMTATEQAASQMMAYAGNVKAKWAHELGSKNLPVPVEPNAAVPKDTVFVTQTMMRPNHSLWGALEDLRDGELMGKLAEDYRHLVRELSARLDGMPGKLDLAGFPGVDNKTAMGARTDEANANAHDEPAYRQDVVDSYTADIKAKWTQDNGEAPPSKWVNDLSGLLGFTLDKQRYQFPRVRKGEGSTINVTIALHTGVKEIEGDYTPRMFSFDETTHKLVFSNESERFVDVRVEPLAGNDSSS